MFVSYECRVLSDRGICMYLITPPEEYNDRDRELLKGEDMARNRSEEPQERKYAKCRAQSSEPCYSSS
jgi:hypothetical protein